jgi:hypothetical protein
MGVAFVYVASPAERRSILAFGRGEVAFGVGDLRQHDAGDPDPGSDPGENEIAGDLEKEIAEEDGVFILTPVDLKTRGMLIGRNATNLRAFESIVQRYFPVKEIKVI